MQSSEMMKSSLPRTVTNKSRTTSFVESFSPNYAGNDPIVESLQLDNEHQRIKAVERIRDFRQKNDFKSKHERDKAHERKNMARENWKQTLRVKREKHIEETVDLSQLQDAIHENPRLLTLSDDDLMKMWKILLTGLRAYAATPLYSLRHMRHFAEFSKTTSNTCGSNSSSNFSDTDRNELSSLSPCGSMINHTGYTTSMKPVRSCTSGVADVENAGTSCTVNGGNKMTVSVKRTKLVKEVFVCGPSALELNELMETSNSPLTVALAPKVIYTSESKENNDSKLSKDIVPKLCFPLDVETNILFENEKIDTGAKVIAVISGEVENEVCKNADYLRETRRTSAHSGKMDGESSSKCRNDIFSERKERSGEKVNADQLTPEIGSKRFVTLFTDDKCNISYGIVFVLNRVFKNETRNVVLITQYCMCLVSDYPYINLFFHLLEVFVAMGGFEVEGGSPLEDQEEGLPISPELRAFNDFSMKLFKYDLPSSGTDLEINIGVAGRRHPVMMKRLNYYKGDGDGEKMINTLLWALPILVRSIPLDQIILIIGCALSEMKILVNSSDANVVSGCVCAILSLMRPLKWCGSLVVPMPSTMPEFIDSIGCCIVGLNELPICGKYPDRGIIVVDPKRRMVDMDPIDVVASETFVLPQAARLNYQLRPLYQSILSLAKKMKCRSPHFSHEVGSYIHERCSNSSIKRMEITDTEIQNAKSTNAVQSSYFHENFDESNLERFNTITEKMDIPPLPIELQVGGIDEDTANDTKDRNDANELYKNIVSFASIMETHLRMIVEVTLKAAWDDKVQKSIARKLEAAKMNQINECRVKECDRYSDTSSSDASDLNLLKMDVSDSTSNDIVLMRIKNVSNLSEVDAKIGDFVKHFRSTQMFCSYCETELVKRRKMTLNENSLLEFGDKNSVHDDCGESMTTSMQRSKKREEKMKSPSIDNRTDEGMKLRTFQKGSAEKNDPLVCLITILLTETIPLDIAKVQLLKEAYIDPLERNEFFCGKDSRINIPLFETSSCTDEPTNILNKGYFKKRSEPDIVWCNGRCMGKANTDQCTLLCLSAWEKKIRATQRQLAIKDIISRHHHADLVMHPVRFPRVSSDYENFLTSDPYFQSVVASMSTSDTLDIRPFRKIRKHPKETQQQYSKRVMITQSKKRPHGSMGTIFTEEADLAQVHEVNILLLQSIFRKKKKSEFKKIALRAIFKIRNFLRFCCQKFKANTYLRKVTQSQEAASILTKVARGYLVRKEVPITMKDCDTLLRKKKLSIIVIRNFLRKVARRKYRNVCHKSTGLKEGDCGGVCMAEVEQTRSRKNGFDVAEIEPIFESNFESPLSANAAIIATRQNDNRENIHSGKVQLFRGNIDAKCVSKVNRSSTGNETSTNNVVKQRIYEENPTPHQITHDAKSIRDSRTHRHNLSSAASSAASFIFGSFLSKQIKQRDRCHSREKQKSRRSLSPDTDTSSHVSISEGDERKRSDSENINDDCLQATAQSTGDTARAFREKLTEAMKNKEKLDLYSMVPNFFGADKELIENPENFDQSDTDDGMNRSMENNSSEEVQSTVNTKVNVEACATAISDGSNYASFVTSDVDFMDETDLSCKLLLKDGDYQVNDSIKSIDADFGSNRTIAIENDPLSLSPHVIRNQTINDQIKAVTGTSISSSSYVDAVVSGDIRGKDKEIMNPIDRNSNSYVHWAEKKERIAQQHNNRYKSPLLNKRLERVNREDKERALIDRDRDKRDKLDRQHSSPILAPPLLPAEENIKNIHVIRDKVDIKSALEDVTKKFDSVSSSPVAVLKRSCEVRNTNNISDIIDQIPPDSIFDIDENTHLVKDSDSPSILSKFDTTSEGSLPHTAEFHVSLASMPTLIEPVQNCTTSNNVGDRDNYNDSNIRSTEILPIPLSTGDDTRNINLKTSAGKNFGCKPIDGISPLHKENDEDVCVETSFFDKKMSYGWFMSAFPSTDDDHNSQLLLQSKKRSSSLSIVGLGSEVSIQLLPQQQRLLLDMGHHMRSGISIVKHGRYGAPKNRILFCDSMMIKLYWRKVGTTADIEDLSLSVDQALAQAVDDRRRRRKSSILNVAKSESDREIYFRDIVEVRDDIQTDVMLRAYKTRAFKPIEFEMKIISIVCRDRTLDFEIKSDDWVNIFHALQVVVKYFKTISNGV